MNYDELATEYANGVDWLSWDDAAGKEVMQNRLIALSQLAAYHTREAERIGREQEQLSNLLMAM